MKVTITLDNLNWADLRRCKSNLRRLRQKRLDHTEDIDMILNLLDQIQEQAVDSTQYSVTEVFG